MKGKNVTKILPKVEKHEFWKYYLKIKQPDNGFNQIKWVSIATHFLSAIYYCGYVWDSKKLSFEYNFTIVKKKLIKIYSSKYPPKYLDNCTNAGFAIR